MQTKSFWIPFSAMVFAAGLLEATSAGPGPYVGYFLLAEAALFAPAYVVALLLGGPGSLGLGAGLGVGLAIVSAVLLGEDCGDSSFLCITPGDAFGLGLVASLIFYPGWALGAGFGARKRRGTRRSEQPPR